MEQCGANSHRSRADPFIAPSDPEDRSGADAAAMLSKAAPIANSGDDAADDAIACLGTHPPT
jgi:hypothetical protein